MPSLPHPLHRGCGASHRHGLQVHQVEARMGATSDGAATPAALISRARISVNDSAGSASHAASRVVADIRYRASASTEIRAEIAVTDAAAKPGAKAADGTADRSDGGCDEARRDQLRG